MTGPAIAVTIAATLLIIAIAAHRAVGVLAPPATGKHARGPASGPPMTSLPPAAPPGSEQIWTRTITIPARPPAPGPAWQDHTPPHSTVLTGPAAGIQFDPAPGPDTLRAVLHGLRALDGGPPAAADTTVTDLQPVTAPGELDVIP